MARGRRGRIVVASVGGLAVACLAASVVEAVTWGPPDPLAGLTAQQVLSKANADLAAARSVTLDGHVTGSSGRYDLDVGDVPGQGCRGTFTYPGKGSLGFVEAGPTAYLRPDSAWWATAAGSGENGVSQLLGGRYLEQRLHDGGQLFPWCYASQLTNSDTDWASLAKGQVTSFAGTRELALDGADGDVLYVTDTAKPEITGISESANDNTQGGGTGESATFDVTVGARVALDVPAPGQTVSAADFGVSPGADGATSPANLGAAMLQSAYANLHSAPTVTIDGSQAYQGQDIAIDMGFKGSQGCAGTIEYGGDRAVKLVETGGEVYLDPNAAYWLNDSEASGASAIISAQDGRYIEVPQDDSNLNGLSGVCGIPASIGQSAPLGTVTAAKVAPGGLTVGKATTIDGVTAVPISDDQGDVIWVSDTARLEIVKAAVTQGPDQGAFAFRVGAPVTLTPPPPADVIAGSAIGM